MNVSYNFTSSMKSMKIMKTMNNDGAL